MAHKTLIGLACLAGALATASAIYGDLHKTATPSEPTAAYEEPAPAWVASYHQQDDNVYWKIVDGGACASYATDGCWHVAVMTRDGCPSYVGVDANEYSESDSIIGSLLDNQDHGIPPETRRLFELDADSGAVRIDDITVDCT